VASIKCEKKKILKISNQIHQNLKFNFSLTMHNLSHSCLSHLNQENFSPDNQTCRRVTGCAAANEDQEILPNLAQVSSNYYWRTSSKKTTLSFLLFPILYFSLLFSNSLRVAAIKSSGRNVSLLVQCCARCGCLITD